MHLLIVRHGECLGQCDPNYYSDPDSALSQLGEQQAHKLAGRLVAEQITHILSSPLIRSLATANVIADLTGIMPVEVWAELREGWNNLYRSFRRAELQQRFPSAVFPASIKEDGWEHGGDSSYDLFFARAKHTLQLIEGRFGPDDRIVIVTHGGFANYLLHAILQIDPSTPQWFELANSSISHVRLVPESAKERPNWPLYPPVKAEVLSINDIAHLHEP
jgi:broad specificity phosphatase PhoE